VRDGSAEWIASEWDVSQRQLVAVFLKAVPTESNLAVQNLDADPTRQRTREP